MKTFDDLAEEINNEQELNNEKIKADYFKDVEEKLKELVFFHLNPSHPLPRFKMKSFALPKSRFAKDVVNELQKDPKWNIQKSVGPDGIFYIVSVRD